MFVPRLRGIDHLCRLTSKPALPAYLRDSYYLTKRDPAVGELLLFEIETEHWVEGGAVFSLVEVEDQLELVEVVYYWTGVED